MGFGSGGSSRSVVVKGVNDILSSSFVNLQTTCKTDVTVSQDVDISCQPLADGGGYYEARRPCVKCYEQILLEQKELYDIYQTQWAAAGKVTRLPAYKDDMGRWLTRLGGCLTSCKACVFSDISISSVSTWDSSCTIDTDVVRQFRSQVKENINQALTNNQDVLSSFAGMLGATDKSEVVENVTNRINNRIGIDFLQEMQNSLSAKQQIEFQGSSNITSGIHQQAAVDALSSFLAENKVAESMFSNSEWAAVAKLQNDENTIGELGNLVKKTVVGVGEASSTLLGQILMGVVGILCAVLLILVSIGWYRYATGKAK